MTIESTLELWLVRHGETTWNAVGRWQGHADAPLSENGIAQAHRLAARISGQRFDAVISSDLSRASDTARIVAAKLEGAPNVILEPLWREIDVGDLSGITYEDSLSRGLHHRFMPFDQRHPNGESSADLAARASQAIDGLKLERMGQHVIVFSHDPAGARRDPERTRCKMGHEISGWQHQPLEVHDHTGRESLPDFQ
jgi:2,3-bisphosphoglycerate-dependent phosphoglycerate mutase